MSLKKRPLVPIDDDVLEVEAKDILHKDILNKKSWKDKPNFFIRLVSNVKLGAIKDYLAEKEYPHRATNVTDVVPKKSSKLLKKPSSERKDTMTPKKGFVFQDPTFSKFLSPSQNMDSEIKSPRSSDARSENSAYRRKKKDPEDEYLKNTTPPTKLKTFRVNNLNEQMDRKQHVYAAHFSTVMIHIHGGGFVCMSSSSHQHYLIKWAKKLDVPIFSIDYRLAPEVKTPDI